MKTNKIFIAFFCLITMLFIVVSCDNATEPDVWSNLSVNDNLEGNWSTSINKDMPVSTFISFDVGDESGNDYGRTALTHYDYSTEVIPIRLNASLTYNKTGTCSISSTLDVESLLTLAEKLLANKDVQADLTTLIDSTQSCGEINASSFFNLKKDALWDSVTEILSDDQIKSNFPEGLLINTDTKYKISIEMSLIPPEEIDSMVAGIISGAEAEESLSAEINQNKTKIKLSTMLPNNELYEVIFVKK